ncbi:scarecrow-like protein 34 [Phragmites australis]|uniref:scarecrow-like protein 34 n=1 Tax=Phragmites australis TaxID=29695 RepID=UPI002D79E29E|nr:scarecrow-like protein 34 [Phragmites australis]
MGSSYDPSPSPGSGADDLFLYLSDLTPASPSSYLDLPPTPHNEQQPSPAGNGGGGTAGSPEDLVLPYISRMLMEEDIDDKFFYDYPDHPALIQAQQPFLDILSDDATTPSGSSGNTHPSCSSSDVAFDASAPLTPAAVNSYPTSFEVDLGPAAFFSASANSDFMSSAFLKGMEEANKFLPSEDKLVIDFDAPSYSSGDFQRGGVQGSNKFLPSEDKIAVGFNGGAPAPPAAPAVAVSMKEEAVDAMPGGGGGRGRKNPYDDDLLELEGGRNSKQSAVQGEDDAARDMFDKIMMPSHEMCVEQMQKLRIAMQEEADKNEGGKAGNGKAKGRRGGREVVDLRTLLIHCAQAVATDDRRSATELLKQIKQHATPQGDATQRLAHCFAEGLQARLAGTGSMVYQSLMAKRTSAVAFLQAYLLYMAAICFKKVVFIFSNHTIYNASLGKKKIHIVDYGIQYGFQWPCFLRHIADREGGPPEVRITGIDLPQPGFRPAERIEETGRRLGKYAHEFGVPFKYQAIAASKMESIRMEELNIDPDEVLIVNCLYQFKNLMDESVVIESPRDIVLNNIRKLRPHTFIHAIVNGSFSAPFFVTRFREAMFFYSALFDVLDTTTPKDSDQRMLIEQNIFGRSALNVIACEGTDRVERPETYKQWQMRNQRAGLKQLPLNPEIVQIVRNKVKNCYHKDFVIDVDHQWLLQGWKGRILYAISTWVANDSGSYF